MSDVIPTKATITIRAILELEEAELRALYVLSQYNPREVADALGRLISPAWQRNHGAAFERFLKGLHGPAHEIISRGEEARSIFQGKSFQAFRVMPQRCE